MVGPGVGAPGVGGVSALAAGAAAAGGATGANLPRNASTAGIGSSIGLGAPGVGVAPGIGVGTSLGVGGGIGTAVGIGGGIAGVPGPGGVFDPRGAFDPRGPLDPRAWYNPGWGAAAAWYGLAAAAVPLSYAYGDTVTYQDGNVYYGDQVQATAEEYYDQASAISQSGEAATNEEWLPLGVFIVTTEKGQTTSDKIVQLSLNKEGAVRGSLYDRLSNKETPMTGAVDKESQRVAVQFEGDDSMVAEMGVYNLANDEVPVLVHFGPDRQEMRYLIRQQPPEDPQQQQQ
jgi:hypothetical protein